MKKVAFIHLAFLLSACLASSTSAPTSTVQAPRVIAVAENSYAPNPEDAGLNRAEVILTSVDLSDRTDLAPARVEIIFSGSMPSVCSEFRAQVNPPDEQHRIYVEAYSVADKIKCADVFQRFETSILLGVYSSGKYSVWVNEKFVGDFISH